MKCFVFILLTWFELFFQKFVFMTDVNPDPKFSEPIINVTVPVGRDAILTCKVHDLISYKVAWLRVDTQTILTIQNHVITKNYRIGISHTEHRIWQLRIRDVRESDRGWYMCQINTDPMKSQLGYLDVVVPPDILDYQTSHDMIIEEGENATLTCTATGLPTPTIIWKREKDKLIQIYRNSKDDNDDDNDQKEIYSYEGQNLTLLFVNRHHMGAYLCIATNGVPPTVSKRILLIVNFAPTIYTHYENIYAIIGQKIILECITESYPSSINYWLRDKEFIQGGIYESITSENIFKIVMRLTIRPIKSKDFGEYKCIAKNSIGETIKSIFVHQINKLEKDTIKIPLQNITSDDYTLLSHTELSFESSLSPSSPSSSSTSLSNQSNKVKLVVQNICVLFGVIKLLILCYLL